MNNSMKCRSRVWTVALLFTGGAVFAADAPKLAAPVYPGAVPALPAEGIKNPPRIPGSFGGVKALDCQGLVASRDIAGRVLSAEEAEKTGEPRFWCFLTRDPIDKVKAYYDKAVGPMHAIAGTWGHSPVQGYAAYAERAWFEGKGEDSFTGFVYHGVSLHALPPPPVKGKEAQNTDDTWAGQEAYKLYAGTRHFNGFMEGVDWFGDPSKRKPAELDALYKKHGHLETALFQRKGPASEPVDETLRARYGRKQNELRQRAMGAAIPSQAQIAQMRAAAQQPMPATQSATPEDAEFNAIMQRKPEVAKKYVALTKKMGELMQQGKLDEADKVDEELQALVAANPELAALERRADERAAAAGAAGQAKENQARAAQAKQLDQANWGTWLEYIEAAEKEAYYTLIVIDRAFRGDEKDYSRDRALFAADTAGTAPHQEVYGFTYLERPQAQAATPAAKPDAPQPLPAEQKNDLGDAAKKGFKALKKLF